MLPIVNFTPNVKETDNTKMKREIKPKAEQPMTIMTTFDKTGKAEERMIRHVKSKEEEEEDPCSEHSSGKELGPPDAFFIIEK